MVPCALRRTVLPVVCPRLLVTVVAVAPAVSSARAQRISGVVVDGATDLPVGDLPVGNLPVGDLPVAVHRTTYGKLAPTLRKFPMPTA